MESSKFQRFQRCYTRPNDNEFGLVFWLPSSSSRRPNACSYILTRIHENHGLVIDLEFILGLGQSWNKMRIGNSGS